MAFVSVVFELPAKNASALKMTVPDSSPITVPLASRVPPTGASGPILLVLAFRARATKASNVFPARALVWLASTCVYGGESLTH